MVELVQITSLGSVNVHDDEAIVVDNDSYFEIDTNTRTISNLSGKKEIARGDHNSERITFECDRYIEGHDVLLCNVIRIYYLVGDKPGKYDVTDLTVKPYDESKVIFTWLVSSDVTHTVGEIAFSIKFKCVQESGDITYSWGTKINKELLVFDSFENPDMASGENVDAFEQVKKNAADIAELKNNSVTMYEDSNGDIVMEVGGVSV